MDLQAFQHLVIGFRQRPVHYTQIMILVVELRTV